MKSFIFIGGDSRSIYAAEKLGERYCCTLYGISGEEKLPESLSDYAVLPLPASTDGVHINCPLLKSAPPGFEILEKTVKKGGTVFTSSSRTLIQLLSRIRRALIFLMPGQGGCMPEGNLMRKDTQRV